jgi:hypothetical protein
MLRFPADRCVPPPEVTARREPQIDRSTVRAIAHAPVRVATPTAHRERFTPAPPGKPRVLRFEHRRPIPGTTETVAVAATGIRAIVHPKAAEPQVASLRRTSAPGSRGAPRKLVFAPSLIRPRP